MCELRNNDNFFHLEVGEVHRSLAIREDSFLQINQGLKVDVYIIMKNLLNKMRVTLVKSFDE